MAVSVLKDRTRGTLLAQQSNVEHTRMVLELLASYDIVKFDGPDADFLGDTIWGGYGTTADAGATALALSAGTAHGEATQITGATDDERAYCTLGSLQWAGEYNAVMAARVKVSAITTVKMEVGFTDALTETAPLGIVVLKATPTFTATNAVCWVFDTDDDALWDCVGVKAGTAATSITDSLAPVADTYETLIVALQEDTARFFRLNASGGQTYASATMTGAVTETTVLVPWVFVQARDAASRTMTIDYIYAWQRRNS